MKELPELVEAAQAGDSEAYEALIQRFQGMAYATAYNSIADHQLAQDRVAYPRLLQKSAGRSFQPPNLAPSRTHLLVNRRPLVAVNCGLG